MVKQNLSNCYYKQLARKTQELYFARNEIHSKTEYIQEQRDIIDQLKQECESLKQEIEILQNNFNTATRDCNDEIEILKQECEELKEQLIQKDEVNTFFNTPIEGWSSNPCDICESKNNYEQLTQECEELKETLNKLTRGVVMPVSEPEVIDLTDRYRKALEEIEEYIKKYECDNCEDFVFGCGDCGTPRDILDIISKAKERENE